MRSIFMVDVSDSWDQVLDAIESRQSKLKNWDAKALNRKNSHGVTLAEHNMSVMLMDIKAALSTVRMQDKDKFCNMVFALCELDKVTDAIFFVGERRFRYQLRVGWRMLVDVALLPVRLLRMIRRLM